MLLMRPSQVKEGVKPELGRSVNIITGSFVLKRLKTMPWKVLTQRPLRSSNTGPDRRLKTLPGFADKSIGKWQRMSKE